MGTPDFAVPVLKAIHESKHKVVCTYTQPPKKKSRGQKIISSSVHQLANKLNINVRCPEILDSKEYEFIKDISPDIVIVVAYGKLIPKDFLDLKGINFINAHASILPKWRGAAPIQRAIMNMDEETGISIMKIINKLDAGPVMKCSKIKISSDCNYETLSNKMSILAASLTVNCLQILENKKEIFIPQNNTEATYAKKIDKLEARINWDDSARKVIAKINALHPNPGSWFKLNGSRIKILKAKEVNKSGTPGEIIDKNLTIACSDNSVQILEVKKEGKKSMSAADFLVGNKIQVGLVLKNV